MMEEYLTTNELSERIRFSKQSLYNLIHKGTFVLGKHYLKPRPKKILFKWSEIQLWMGECSHPTNNAGSKSIDKTEISKQINHSVKHCPAGRINI